MEMFIKKWLSLDRGGGGEGEKEKTAFLYFTLNYKQKGTFFKSNINEPPNEVFSDIYI